MATYRLDQFISQRTDWSRRKAQKIIQEGFVQVDFKVIQLPGHRIQGKETIHVQNILLQKKITPYYVALHKPTGYITSCKDDQGRKTVMDLIKGTKPMPGLVPVGRLDRETSGLLLLSNDGLFVYQVTHPKFQIEKTYIGHFKKPIKHADLLRLKEGLNLSDGFFRPDHAELLTPYKLLIKIHSGKNRILRRFFEAAGLPLMHLTRTAVGDIQLGSLPVGHLRLISKKAVHKSIPIIS